MRNHLDRFLKTKLIEGCTQKTLNAYSYEIERFISYLEKSQYCENPDLGLLNQELVEDWLAASDIESATRARMLAALKSFSRFLHEREVLEKNPLERLKTPRIRKKTISFLTDQEFKGLLKDANQPARAKEIPGRDFAILALFIGSGIRISELAGLKLKHLDLNTHQIKVTRKGGKEQYIPIGYPVIDALKNWLEVRRDMKLANEVDALFISNRKRAMSIQTIRNVVKKWMKKSGLWGKKMSPHTLRHSYATAQIAAGTPVQIVQELLGHNQLNTTSKYLHIVDKEYKKAADKIRF